MKYKPRSFASPAILMALIQFSLLLKHICSVVYIWFSSLQNISEQNDAIMKDPYVAVRVCASDIPSSGTVVDL